MKISLQQSLYIGIAGILLVLMIVFLLPLNLPGYINLASLLGQPNVGLPVRIKIPSIKVDAVIEQVSLTSQGAVGVPKGIANAGWFSLGPRPGQTGSAIIDGHFGWWKDGTPEVFNDLYTLKKGDKLYIEDEKGVTVTFVVREIKTYDQNEDTSGVFNPSDGKAHLNIITCEGVWIKTLKTYSNRLVIFTDKE